MCFNCSKKVQKVVTSKSVQSLVIPDIDLNKKSNETLYQSKQILKLVQKSLLNLLRKLTGKVDQEFHYLQNLPKNEKKFCFLKESIQKEIF